MESESLTVADVIQRYGYGQYANTVGLGSVTVKGRLFVAGSIAAIVDESGSTPGILINGGRISRHLQLSLPTEMLLGAWPPFQLSARMTIAIGDLHRCDFPMYPLAAFDVENLVVKVGESDVDIELQKPVVTPTEAELLDVQIRYSTVRLAGRPDPGLLVDAEWLRASYWEAHRVVESARLVTANPNAEVIADANCVKDTIASMLRSYRECLQKFGIPLSVRGPLP